MALNGSENDIEYDILIEQKGYTKFLSDDGYDGTIVDEILISEKDEQLSFDNTPNDKFCETQTSNSSSIRLSLSQEQICIDKNKTAGEQQSFVKTKNLPKTILSNKPHLSILPESELNNDVSLDQQQHIDPSNLTKCIQQDNDFKKDVVQLSSLRKFSIPMGYANNAKEQSKKFECKNTFTDIQVPNYLEKFKCSFCKHFFNDPRVLECLHTFCLQCITIMESNNGIQNRFMANKNKSSDIAGGELEFNLSENIKSSESSVSKSISTVSLHDIDPSLKRKNSKFSVRERKSFGRNSSSVTFHEKTKLIKCFTCGFATTCNGLNRLPQHTIYVKKMYANNINKNEADPTICNTCSDEIEAIAFCLRCNLNLCNTCKEEHLRQPTTSSHNISELLINKIDGNNLETLNKKCSIHATIDLKLFCTTCYQVICHNCTILLHRNHKYESIYKAAKYNLKLIRDNLDRTRPLTDYANDSISRLNKIAKKINQKADDVQNDVEIFLEQYFEAITVHKNILLTQISRAKETKMHAILNQQTDLEKRSHEAQMAISFTEELLTDGNDIDLLTFLGVLLQRFQHFQNYRAPLDPKTSDCIQFLPNVKAPSTNGQNNIPMYGIIATQIAIPKLCTLNTDGLMFLRVNRKSELKLVSRDIDDRPLCHGGLKIDVQLKYKNASRIVPTQVSDKRDGTYIISFEPDAAGTMELFVTIADKPIKNSPFQLCARSLRPHSGSFHCCTFCSSNGSKDATCACGSRMPSYKGCGHGHEGHPGRRHWSCCGSDLESSECSATNTFRDQLMKTD